MRALRHRVWGLGCRVWGFRVEGFKAQGLGGGGVLHRKIWGIGTSVEGVLGQGLRPCAIEGALLGMLPWTLKVVLSGFGPLF